MALVVPTREGPLQVSDSEIRAATRNAIRQADLTAVALNATGVFTSAEGERPDWSRLPPGYLLELAATIQIGLWERQGLLPHLAPDLPSFHEAAQVLLDRAGKGPAEFRRNYWRRCDVARGGPGRRSVPHPSVLNRCVLDSRR